MTGVEQDEAHTSPPPRGLDLGIGRRIMAFAAEGYREGLVEVSDGGD
jgi:hypothetical protein